MYAHDMTKAHDAQAERAQAPLGTIGGGTMATAILSGALEAGLSGPFGVADRNADRRALFDISFQAAGELLAWLERTEAAPGAGRVMLAVKPQSLEEVGDEIGEVLSRGPERCVISVLAGVTTERLRAVLGGRVRIVRVMPNTPASVGLGMSAVCAGQTATPGDLAYAVRLFEAVGRAIVIDEAMIDPFTGVAGSGPAYVFYLAEALTRAAERMGFSNADADAMVRQTILGSAELLARSPEQSAEVLRAAVSSRRGATLEATGVFDRAGLVEIVERAVHASRDRSAELGRG